MIYYEACFGRIQPIEILKETKEFIVLPNGRRESKGNGWSWRWIRSTKQEAKDAMVAYHRKKVEMARKHLEEFEKDLQKALEIPID